MPCLLTTTPLLRPLVLQVTLHVRIQLLGVMLLLRCICQAGTLVIGREMLRDNTSVTAATLLTYLFVFFEDGQGFVTFLLLALHPPFPAPSSPFPPTPGAARRAARASKEGAVGPREPLEGFATGFGYRPSTVAEASSSSRSGCADAPPPTPSGASPGRASPAMLRFVGVPSSKGLGEASVSSASAKRALAPTLL